MANQRRRMPSKEKIVEYWRNSILDDGQFNVDNCFACGCNFELQRCHITAKCNGGTDTVDNLHILCIYCHKESEPIEGDNYFMWYNIKFSNEYDFGFSKLRSKMLLVESIVKYRNMTVEQAIKEIYNDK